MYRLIKQKFQDGVSLIESSKTFEQDCAIICTKLEYDNFFEDRDSSLHPIIYVDQDNKGFSYGQFITHEIIKISFTESNWPRLLVYAKVLEEGNERSILGEKSPINTNSVKDNVDEEKYFRKANRLSNNEDKIKQSENNDQPIYEDGFTLRRSTSKRESYYACLKMLNDYFKLPLRMMLFNAPQTFLRSEMDHG